MYNAAYFSVCKQNWRMLRQVNPERANLGSGNCETGGVFNDNLALDMELIHASMEYFRTCGRQDTSLVQQGLKPGYRRYLKL